MLRTIVVRSNRCAKPLFPLIKKNDKNKKISTRLTNPWSGKKITDHKNPMNENTIKNVIENYFPSF